ncbi:MAG: lactoylglutathione lyase [Actinomycetia bacterium]|nr:lactoylglutathione lyase [Actinomycetes bacterium]
MQIAGVHHVSIMTPDVDAALAFYVDVLGLTPRTDRPDFGIGGAWLDAGGQQVHLVEGATPNRAGQHFAFRVTDLDATITELRDLGYDVRDPFVTTVGRQTTVDDPAGNIVELNQPN